MSFELVKFILTIVSLLFTATQIYFVVLEIKSNKKWNQQDVAFKFCLEYNNIIDNIDSNLKNSLNLIDLTEIHENGIFYANLFNSDSQEGVVNREQINKLLRYYERLSVGILCNYFDEEVTRRILNRTFTVTYKNLRPYILMRRGETNVKIFSHYERVAETWIKSPLEYPQRDTPSARKEWNY